MGDIGNVDVKFVVPALQAAHQHGIVKVAGRFSVDGHNRQVAIINPAGNLAGWNDRTDLLRLFQNFRRENMRDVVLADDHFHIHAKIVFISEDLHHPPAGALRCGGPLHDFDLHNHIFEIVPLATLDFCAQDPMWGGFGRMVRTPRRPLLVFFFLLDKAELWHHGHEHHHEHHEHDDHDHVHGHSHTPLRSGGWAVLTGDSVRPEAASPAERATAVEASRR